MNIIKKSIATILAFLLLYVIIQNVADLGKDVTISFFDQSVSTKAGFWFILFYVAGILSWMYFDLVHTLSRRKLISTQKKEILRLGEELRQYRNQSLETTENAENATNNDSDEEKDD